MTAPDFATTRRTGSPEKPARICCSTSHNPVDWWPWGPQALAEAARTGKPILLSVGYAACHWCHVMAHESFEDVATAAVMNELFVNMKVDREERPDIDQIYMAALHQLGEQGGWPLTMFLTPDGEPVWGGTYFPNDFALRPTGVRRRAARGRAPVPRGAGQDPAEPRRADGAARREGAAAGPRDDRREPSSTSLAQQIAGAFDPENGGLRGAPKFPNAALYELVWRAGLRTGEARYFDAIVHTLERICEGGIYDHLGGGFSRYSVDAALAGAAFREDALRQRPASRPARAGASRAPATTCSAPARARPSAGSHAR